MSMLTRWGKALDPAAVLPEYPRPQLVRESYINLNGLWDYAIYGGSAWPEAFDGKILVPFSPEAELSGVGGRLLAWQTLWYERSVDLCPEAGRRLILHFGAVDQIAKVYINQELVTVHVGGYTAFEVDITNYIHCGQNTITVAVKDETDANQLSRGKQKTRRGGIWYTPQSGIWQTVWMEWVPEIYIRALRITPSAAHRRLTISVQAESDCDCAIIFADRRIEGRTNRDITLSINEAELWTPETPRLYDFAVELGEDRVESYFALRDITLGHDAAGRPCMLLNGRPYYQSGVLDQGYWPDGLYTAPSDAAMIYDITLMKSMGFNMLRKHIKLEPMRWYYHCDRLGMLVWQDMMSGGGQYDPVTISAPLITRRHIRDNDYRRFARTDSAGRVHYYAELEELITQLYNSPCVVLWVPFNEGWGQFDAAEAVRRIEALDPTRPIDHASGWHDQGIGGIKSLHVYFYPYRFKPDALGRVVVLSEFGGYQLPVAGHTYNNANFGYRAYKSAEALGRAFQALYERQILPARKMGLAASVYTQLSDVEDEVNGFISYDREVVKLDAAAVRAINARLISGE